MKIPSSRTRRDMEAAAELRASGATWDTAAEHVGRQPTLLMRWARVYREEWERMLREAEERLSRQASNESRSTLRVLLRCDNPRVRVAAADKLVRHRFEEKAREAPPDPQVDRFAFLAQVEEMSDADLQHLLAELVHRIPGPGGGPAAANPPGAAGPG